MYINLHLYDWRHRHDTPQQRLEELRRHWEGYLEVVKDEPATIEMREAMQAMDDVLKKETWA